MSQSSPVSGTAIFECREYREDAFRSMEVQICGETKTVQFCVEDHGGDHPTAPSVAINWNNALDLANWILSRTSDHAQDPLVQKIEAEARRYAEMYPQSSDGRNTFVIFADWVAALALSSTTGNSK